MRVLIVANADIGLYKFRKELLEELVKENEVYIALPTGEFYEELVAFAKKYNISPKEAFQYLFNYKGIEFLKENYEVEHTLSFDNVVEDVSILCRRNGGIL